MPVLVNELDKLVLDYPLFFIKDSETGQFGLHALTGFYPAQNLFINKGQWQASYLPLHISRQPFLLGAADKTAADQQVPILINTQSSRINSDDGHAIFTADGCLSAYMEKIKTDLVSIYRGTPATQQFIDFMTQHGLIESLKLDISFKNGQADSFQGLYTVNTQQINELATADLLHGAQHSYLGYMALISASIGNVSKLITLA